MRLIANWQQLWFRLWSARLNMACAAILVADFMASVLLDKRAPLWVIAGCALLNVAAIVVRMVWQPAAHIKAEIAACQSQTTFGI